MMTVHSMKIRTRWNSATTAKITPATRENVFAPMSHHSKFLTPVANVERTSLPEGCANATRAGWKPLMSDEQYIDKLSMPQSAMADLARAVPKDFVRPSWEITTAIAQPGSRVDLRPLIHDYCATSISGHDA